MTRPHLYLVVTMAATLNYLLVSLAGLAIGWILAVRALAEMSPVGPLVAVGFLALVVWGLIKAARI